jgi:hypothetical protein
MGEIQIVDGHENCSNEFDVLRRLEPTDASTYLISLNGSLIRKEFDLDLERVRPDAAQSLFITSKGDRGERQLD